MQEFKKKYLNLEILNTSLVTNMEYMFKFMGLKDIDFSNFNISSAINMYI